MGSFVLPGSSTRPAGLRRAYRQLPPRLRGLLAWVPALCVPVLFWLLLQIDTRTELRWTLEPILPRQEAPGVQVLPEDFRTHLPEGVPSRYAYTTDPPTSGPHWEDVRVPAQVVPYPLPVEIQLHELEHGAILLQYRCDTPCPDLVERLGTLAATSGDVLVAPNPTLPSRVVATAWRRRLALETLDEGAVGAFIAAYRSETRRITPLAPVRFLLTRLAGAGRQALTGTAPGVRPGLAAGPPLPSRAPLPAAWSFDDLEPGTLPPGWRVAGRDLEGGGPGWWRVESRRAGTANNALRLRSTTGHDHLLLLPGEHREFTFRAAVLWEPSDQATHQFGVVFRGADLWSYYRLRLYQRALSNFPVVYLARVDDFVPHTLYEAGLETLQLRPATWYDLRLTVSGDRIAVAIAESAPNAGAGVGEGSGAGGSAGVASGAAPGALAFEVQDEALPLAPSRVLAISGFANSRLWVDDVAVERAPSGPGAPSAPGGPGEPGAQTGGAGPG